MTFSSQFIEVLDALCEKFGVAIDWTSQNVLPYVIELAARIVSYEIWTSAAWIVIAGFFFLFVWKFTKNICLKKGIYMDDELSYYVGWTFRIALGICSFVVVSGEVFDIIKALTVPEMVIYDFIKGVGVNG